MESQRSPSPLLWTSDEELIDEHMIKNKKVRRKRRNNESLEETIEQSSSHSSRESDHVEEFEEIKDALKPKKILPVRELSVRSEEASTSSRHSLNSSQVFTINRKKVLYGRTPVAISRSHFLEIAQFNGISAEEFAHTILNSDDKKLVEVLQAYYCTKVSNLGPFFDNLITSDVSKEFTKQQGNNERKIHEIKYLKNIKKKKVNVTQPKNIVHKARNKCINHKPSQNKSSSSDVTKKVKERKITVGQKNEIRRVSELEEIVSNKTITRPNEITIIPETESDDSDNSIIPASPEELQLKSNSRSAFNTQTNISSNETLTTSDSTNVTGCSVIQRESSFSNSSCSIAGYSTGQCSDEVSSSSAFANFSFTPNLILESLLSNDINDKETMKRKSSISDENGIEKVSPECISYNMNYPAKDNFGKVKNSYKQHSDDTPSQDCPQSNEDNQILIQLLGSPPSPL